MKLIAYTVSDPNGIHARPAGAICATAKKFKSEITAIVNDKRGSCKKIFALMGLGVKGGDTLSIEICGSDEEEAAAAMSNIFESEKI